MKKIIGAVVALALAAGFLELLVFAQDGHGPVQVLRVVKYDVSPPLRTIPPLPPQAGPKRELPLRAIWPDTSSPAQTDPVVQASQGPLASATVGLSLLGIGTDFSGYTVEAAPPDTNGAVGDTQYVQSAFRSLERRSSSIPSATG
jgi:hypothetical protein